MKYRLTLVLIFALLFGHLELCAQLNFIGLDKIGTFDGYKKGFYAGGMVAFKGKYYFSTPNGKLYQTDGTLAGTGLKRSSQSDILLLKATNKFMYYTGNDGYGTTLRQYSPESDFVRQFSTVNYAVPTNRLCPSCEVAAGEGFVAFEGNKLYTRTFANGTQYIREIHDDNPDVVTEVFQTPLPMDGIDFMLVNTNTRIAAIRDEVFFNGTINFRDGAKWETSVTAFEKVPGDPISYKLQTDYRLKSKGYTIYQGFLRTPTALYVLIRKTDNTHLLARLEKGQLRSLAELPLKVPLYNPFVIDGQLYITAENKVYRYLEKEDRMLLVYEATGTAFEKLSGAQTLLKVGAHLMFKQDGTIKVLNDQTQQVDVLSATVAFTQRARMDRSKIFAMAGKKVFYVLEDVGGKKVVNQYDPVKKAFIEIDIPVEKKESFVDYHYLEASDDKLLILTEFKLAKEKDPPLYKMFMYREQ